jgi:hypothetical protein
MEGQTAMRMRSTALAASRWTADAEGGDPGGSEPGLRATKYRYRLPAGYIVLQSDVFSGFALLRSNLASHSDSDVAKSVAYGKQIKVYPLANAKEPPPTNFTDAYDVLFDSTIPYDASFYRHLDRVVQSEPCSTATAR